VSGQANLGEIDWTSVYDQQQRSARVDSALQIGIAVLSIAAAYLIASTGPWQRWGFVIGLASQPLWFIVTWRARQYGILLVAIFYTGAWVQGIANRFSF
jgi:hypothetical protein